MTLAFEVILSLLGLAVVITTIAKEVKQPYPIALVIVGLIIGLTDLEIFRELTDFVTQDEFFYSAIIFAFLPALLGEATLKLPYRNLVHNRKPILALAIVGTFLTYLIVGFLTVKLLNLPIQIAFVFASLMSATDPVSVISIFKAMGVGHDLETIMEGESLFNDGVAVVLFRISVYSLMTYLSLGWLGIGYGLIKFLTVAVGGLIIGSILAYIVSKIIKRIDDYPVEIIYSMILFYGSFYFAEALHVSGVIAVVTAGLIFGNYGSEIGMSPTTRLSIRTFWDVLAVLANSIIFLMVGLEISRINIWDKLPLIFTAILIVLLARSLAVYLSLTLVKGIPNSWKHLFNWGGLKGSLSIALALSLPASFPQREDILVMVFGVVVFSLIVQGLTVAPLVKYLKLTKEVGGLTEYEETIARINRYKAAKQSLTNMHNDALISRMVYHTAINDYDDKLSEAYTYLEELYSSYPALKEQQVSLAKQQALFAEHEALEELVRSHIISEQVAQNQRKKVIDLLEEEKSKHD